VQQRASPLEFERTEGFPDAANQVDAGESAVFACLHFRVLDCARIGVSLDRDFAIGPAQAFWSF